MDLFKRRPRFRLSYRQQEPLINDTKSYPALAADFSSLDTILMPEYYRYDKEALLLQNAHWWTYVILIVGGAIATICGILQIAFNIDVFGLMGAIVAAVLGAATLVLNSFHYQEHYMNARLIAERLRGEYFLFLGRLGEYQDSDQEQRVEKLKGRVLKITENIKEGKDVQELRQQEQQKKQEQQETIDLQIAKQILAAYQLYRHQNQLEFYRNRVREFTSAQRQATWLSISLIFLTALAGAFEGVVPVSFKIILLLVAAICPILATTLAGYTALHAFTQQAKLYSDARKKLIQIDIPQRKPNQTPRDFAGEINNYVENVERVLRTEQGFWGQLIEDLTPPGA